MTQKDLDPDCTVVIDGVGRLLSTDVIGLMTYYWKIKFQSPQGAGVCLYDPLGLVLGGPWKTSPWGPETEGLLVSWDPRTHCRALPGFFSINRSLVPCCALFSQHMHSRHWPLGFHGRLQFAGHSEQKLGEQAQSPPYSHRLPSAFPSFCLCLWSHASSFSHLELVTVLQALPPLSHQVLSTWNVLSCTSTPFYTYWAPTHSSKQSQMPPLPGSLPKSPQLEFLTFSSPILP